MSFHSHELPCGFIRLGSSSDLRDASSFTFLNPPLHSATLLLLHSPINPLVFTAPILACRLVTTQHTSPTSLTQLLLGFYLFFLLLEPLLWKFPESFTYFEVLWEVRLDGHLFHFILYNCSWKKKLEKHHDYSNVGLQWNIIWFLHLTLSVNTLINVVRV